MARLPNDPDRLVEMGSALVAEAVELDDQKTQVLIRLAKVIVQLRSRFKTTKGDVDWAGRSQEYRDTAARIYSEAGVPPDSASNIQAAVRYHVGNVLRDVAPAEAIEAAGLQPASPRQQRRKSRNRAQASAQEGVTQEAIDLRDTALQSIERATQLIHRSRDKLPEDSDELEAVQSALARHAVEVFTLQQEVERTQAVLV
jgi:hypothetical protein